MNKLCCIIGMFITCGVCSGQNLIPNPSFEDTVACPTWWSQLYNAEHWLNPTTNGGGGLSGTPDYFNSCAGGVIGVPNNFAGYQQAHSGNAYAGIFLIEDPGDSLNYLNYREYLEIIFSSWLQQGVCYHFEMYVSLADSSIYTTDAIGVAILSLPILGVNNWYPLPCFVNISNPIGNMFDTLNWSLVSGNYIASGGETSLIIGNFKYDSLTTTSVVNPNGSASDQMAYVYIDDVCLTPCGSSCNTTGIEKQYNNESITIYPNPVKDKLNISISNRQLSEIILYDIVSRKLLQKEFTSFVSLNTEQLAKGIYLYEVRNKKGVIKKGKIVKD